MINNLITNGLKWRALQQVLVQGVNFIIFIVLNRLLTPTEFGVLGLSMLVFGFVEMIRSFGLGSALIKKDQPDQAFLSTLFWTNMLLSIVLGGLFWCLSGLLAAFFQVSILADIYKVLAFVLMVNGLALVPRNLLLKELQFKRLFFLQLIIVLFSGSVAIGWAWYFRDVWSLIIRFGLSSVLGLLILYFWVPWRPGWTWSKLHFSDIWSYSSPLLVSNMINYFIRNIDDLLIGRFLGTASLGLYNRAYTLMQFPAKQLSGPFVGVLFPAFSKLGSQTDRIGGIYLRVIRAIVFVSLPVMLTLFFVASPFIQLLLGEKWLGVVPVLQIFCVLGVTQSVGTLSGSIFLSTANTKLQLKLDIITKSLTFVLILWGLNYGISGVAMGYTLGSCISIIFYLRTIAKILNLELLTIWKTLRQTFLIGMFLLAALFLADQLNILLELAPFWNVFVSTLIGVVVYIGLHIKLKTDVWQDVWTQYENFRKTL